MKFLIEHLQKRTVPHDILEELKESNVRFYDGWLIVRVVDHKSAASSSTTSTQASSDDQTPFSIHNYTPYITPSAWAPYPTKEQPKTASPTMRSQTPKQESGTPVNESDGKINDANKENNAQDGAVSKASVPRVYHIALRPTALSQHQDIIIDAMTPDPKSIGKKQAQMPARTPGSATGAAPPTPLSAVPSTPVLERGHPAKRQKMKIEPRDLLDYEARIVNATAPPLWLEPVNSAEEADELLEFMRDPYHDEDPPSPRGRKRTVAELAADEAIAKEEERFMLIMDERLAPGAAGATGASAAATDGQAGVPLFQPRFEKFNALENIKAQHKENKRLEHEKKVQQDHMRRVQQEAMEEKRRQQHTEMEQQERERQLRNRQMMAARELARQQAVQQPHGMPGVNGAMPAMQHQQQQQMMQASQAQRSSPVVRAMSPHVNSSPVVGNMSAPGHSVPMNVTSSNQGGSPPRPGSAVQHAHPGVQMVRNVSQQGMSRQGTPQMPQATPSMRQATPIMRTATPNQRMNASSPHGSMMAPTPQMAQTGMMGTPQMAVAQASAQQAMLQQRQQQMIQHQQQMQAQGQQMSNADFAHFQAQQHALQQQRMAQQQLMHQAAAQQQGQHHSPQPVFQNQQQQAAYQAQVAQMMKQQMAHAQNQGQGQGSPQHQGMQMGTPQPQRPTTSGSQGGPNNSLIHQRFLHHRNNLLRSIAQNFGGQPNNIPQQQLELINNQAQQQARHDVSRMMQHRNQMQARQAQMAMQGMGQQGQNPQQQQMMMNPQLQAQMIAQMQQQQQQMGQQMGKQG